MTIPIFCGKFVRINTGIKTFNTPIPSPSNAVPTIKPKTPRYERIRIPKNARERQMGTSARSLILPNSLPAAGDTMAKISIGMVVNNPAKLALSPSELLICDTRGPMGLIGDRIQKHTSTNPGSNEYSLLFFIIYCSGARIVLPCI